MISEYQVRVLPEVAAQQERLVAFLADEYGLDKKDVTGVRILKRSIDARQRTIYVNLRVRVYINEVATDDVFEPVSYQDVSDKPQVIVVGAGPGGLFAALRLIELGLRPVVIERGKDVHERKKDLAQIARTQQVDEESNYCFGEGGAVPIATASSIPVRRSAALLRRYSECSVSMVLRQLFWPMPIRILAPTDCHRSSRPCATPSSVVAVRCTSRRR